MADQKTILEVDPAKLIDAIKRVGTKVYGGYCEAAVTLGEVDGVVYRVVAMDSMSAEDKDCAEGPEWARCVSKAAGQEGNDHG